MNTESKHQYPKLHNATWPGLVGKGGPDGEPIIEFETMLDLTAAAEVDGVRFDGVDIFLSLPHTDIDSTDDDLKRLADRLRRADLSSVRWSRLSGDQPAAARRWVLPRNAKRFSHRLRKPVVVGKKLQ